MKFFFVFLFLLLANVVAIAQDVVVEQCEQLFGKGSAKYDTCRYVRYARREWPDDDLRAAVQKKHDDGAAELARDQEWRERKRHAVELLEKELRGSALRLKGLYPGITLAAASKFHIGLDDFCTDQANLNGPFTCHPRDTGGTGKYALDTLNTLAGNPVSVWTLSGTNGVIWEISALMSSDGAVTLQNALMEKYRFGKTTTATVSNRFGARFENRITIWRSADQKLVVEKYATTLDNGWVQFSSSKAPKTPRPPSGKDL